MQPNNDDVIVSNASGKPVSVCGTISLLLKIEKSTEMLRSYVVDNLATTVIVECAFCYWYLDAIFLRLKNVRLDDGVTLSVVRQPSKANSTLLLHKEQLLNMQKNRFRLRLELPHAPIYIPECTLG